jgi:flagellar hook-associated protein 3 FlgL
MISGMDPNSERFLTDLDQVQQRIERAQAQISSGLRVNKPSDGPDQIHDIIESGADLARIDQITQNLTRVKVEVDAGEAAVAAALPLLDRAATLASQAAGSTATAAQRKLIASEVEALQQQMVALTNTRVDGRYIFAGDLDQSQPYTLDLTSAAGVTPYAGTVATREIEAPSGARFTTARTAQEIFDDPGGSSALTALNNLRLALETDDQPGIESALVAIGAAGDHVNQQLFSYGTAQNQVAAATDAASKAHLRADEALSGARDADLVEASIELARASTQQQASLAARARLPRTSLFDYLG